MPEISRFYGIVIQIYFADHNPPHFHAFYGGESVEIEIQGLGIMAGEIAPRALSMVMEWAALLNSTQSADWPDRSAVLRRSGKGARA